MKRFLLFVCLCAQIRRALFRRCGRIARGVEAIKKTAMPMLLMHGTDDKIVSFR